jgi:hypothetical protein
MDVSLSPFMEIKLTPQFLAKLEDVFAESDYVLRYEKGNFHAGYCVLKDTKIAIVNKYFTVDGKINCLIEILKSIEIDTSKLSDKNRTFYQELNQTELKL